MREKVCVCELEGNVCERERVVCVCVCVCVREREREERKKERMKNYAETNSPWPIGKRTELQHRSSNCSHSITFTFGLILLGTPLTRFPDKIEIVPLFFYSDGFGIS